MRILVCGSRHLRDYDLVRDTLEELDTVGEDKYRVSTVIDGMAKGADSLAHEWARVRGKYWDRYPALWDIHGKAAGPIRNKQMLDEGKPDMVVAFLAKDSRGTKNMIEQAEKAGIPVKVVNI